MTRARFRAAIVLAGLGTLAGCGSADDDARLEPAATTSAAAATATTQAASAPATTSGDTDTGASAEPATTTAAVSQETRAEIVLLEGALLDGQQFDLAATAGNDVLLWFWAPW